MALRLGSLAGRAREETDRSESSCVGIGLTTMDRIFRAIIACAVLLLLGAASLYVTNAADLIHHARTVGVAGRNR